MIVAILLILVLILVYFYFSSTMIHLYHTARMVLRMLLVVSFVLLVIGLLLYCFSNFNISFLKPETGNKKPQHYIHNTFSSAKVETYKTPEVLNRIEITLKNVKI